MCRLLCWPHWAWVDRIAHRGYTVSFSLAVCVSPLTSDATATFGCCAAPTEPTKSTRRCELWEFDLWRNCRMGTRTMWSTCSVALCFRHRTCPGRSQHGISTMMSSVSMLSLLLPCLDRCNIRMIDFAKSTHITMKNTLPKCTFCRIFHNFASTAAPNVVSDSSAVRELPGQLWTHMPGSCVHICWPNLSSAKNTWARKTLLPFLTNRFGSGNLLKVH